MPERRDTVQGALSGIALTARHLYEGGFGESFFGNISVLLRGRTSKAGPQAYPLDISWPGLEGALLLITRTGSTMLGIASCPEENVGTYLIDRNRLRLVKGVGPPSTELASHLAIHSRLGLGGSSVVHCHIGETLRELEAVDPLPDWIRTVPALPPGSTSLATASAERTAPDVLLVWRGHGIVAISTDLETASTMIDRAVDLARAKPR